MKVSLMYSTAYHPQADGQSERSNQTAEIAMRYYIATLADIRQWPEILARMSAALNNSTKYSTTNQTPTQVMFGFRTKEALDLLRIDDPEAASQAETASQAASQEQTASQAGTTTQAQAHLTQAPAAMDEYRPAHIDAKDAIAFAAMKMKEYYDRKHTPIYFKEGDWVHLRLHKGYKVPAIKSKKTGQQFVGPFHVAKRIGRLAYQLDLPERMRIHNVISIAHLEPATNPASDPYQRRRLAVPVVVDNQDEWEIERLLQKRRIRRGRGWSVQYLVRWKDCGPEDDMWLAEAELLRNAADLVEAFSRENGDEVALRA